MIYTVTLNPSLDYVLDVDDLKAGIINRSSAEKLMAGGKGINISIVLNELGVGNCALGFIGGFTGEKIKSMLADRGVNTDFVEIEGETRINVKVRASIETQINAVGPKISLEDVEHLFHCMDRLSEDDILVLAGSIPDMLSEDIYSELIELVINKGTRVVLDTTGEALGKCLIHNPFLIKLNDVELGEYFKTTINKDNALSYAKRLQRKGGRNILISLGSEGAVLLCEDGKDFYSLAHQGIIVNTVGAGDSMVAGFLYGLEQEQNFEKAFNYAVAAGSASAFSEGLAERAMVEKLYERGPRNKGI